MKIKLKIMFLLFIATIAINKKANSQNASDSSSAFSISEAQEYAIKNNATFLNAEIDQKIALAKKREITGLGMPQISSSFDIKDFLEIPTSLLPGEIFGAPAGVYIPVKFGVKYNATASGQVSQLVFNSDYIVGLQASKAYLELSEKATGRTKIETYATVAKAYYQVLINKERIKLLEKNITRIQKLHDDTKALNENGFVEKIDVDRIDVAYNNLLVELEKTKRLIGLTETLLKFQMGYDVSKPIILKDKLDMDNLPAIDEKAAVDTSKIDFKNRIEYSLVESQLKLGELDLKRYRLSYLPTVVAYGSLSAQAQRNTFDIFDTKKGWYPTAVIGGTINLPIFDGLQKHYKIEQARLSLLKTKNSAKNLENAITLEVTSARTMYSNAISSLSTQKKNMELAERIYNVSKKKYDAGVGSNIEVITAETSLKESQTNYYNAMYDFLVAKIDLDKSLGNIK